MGQKYALIIATAEYQDTGLARLAAPGLDAHDFAGALKAPQIGAFDSVQTLLNAAEAVVRRAIARFFDQRKPDDLLLLYFSGHGVRDDRGQLFLAVNDTDRSLLSATAIPANFVNDHMNTSRSRRQVLILDCCNSGAFAQGSKAPLGGSMGIATAFEGTGYGRVVLTATDATQYAWEGDEARGEAANSVFTHFLVKGLETGAADGNGDGRITLDELYDYVYEQVVTQTPRQTPRKFAYNQQGDVVIAHNPRPVLAPAPLPEALQQAVESGLAGVREAAVRELDGLLRGSHRGLALAALEALERLTQDDSRRVSTAAAASLAAHGAAQRQAQAAGEALAAAEQAAAEQRAAEQAAAEQRAAERRAAEQAAQRRAAEQAEREAAAEQAAQKAADEAAQQQMLEKQAQAQAAAEQAAAEVKAAQRRAAEQAEQERQAKLQAAEAAEALRPPPPAKAAAEAAAITLTPEQQRRARDLDEAAWRQAQARPVLSQPGAVGLGAVIGAIRAVITANSGTVLAGLWPGGERRGRRAWSLAAPLLYTALAALGWGYAREWAYDVATLVYGNGDSTVLVQLTGLVYWVAAGTLGGLALGLILALARPAFRGPRILTTALGWGVASAISWVITWTLGETNSMLVGYLFGPTVMGALGGWGLVRALDGGAQPALTRRQAVIIAGWALACFAQYYVQDIATVDVSEFTAGVLAGLIGGGLMFWALRSPAADVPLFSPGGEVQRQGVAWGGLPWLAYTALLVLGWGQAGVMGDRAYELVVELLPDDVAVTLAPAAYWVTQHTLGAAVTVAVLALSRPALRAWRSLGLVAGWGLVSALGWGLSWLVSQVGGWEAGLWLGLALVGALGGGLLTRAAVGWPAHPAAWRRLGFIALGWAIGLAAPYMVDINFPELFGYFGDAALAGLIGGGVMFWLLGGKREVVSGQ